MAYYLSQLTLSSQPPPMASLSGAATSRLLPSAAFRVRLYSSSLSPLSFYSSSSSYSPSSLKCFRSSPLGPHVFLKQVSFLSLALYMQTCMCVVVVVVVYLVCFGAQKGSWISTVAAASDPAQLKSAREDIKELLKSKFCHPILVYIYF